MSNSRPDYDKKTSTDISAFYPSNLDNEFIHNLNESVFNRFLTKRDSIEQIGVIGDPDTESGAGNIVERNESIQANQLRPVLTATTQSGDIFLTWDDFIRKLGRRDVDVDNFDKWGSVTQFNWVPPIDLDKFINFRDYYWNSSLFGVDTPDYITIANETLRQATILRQMLKTESDIFASDGIGTVIASDVVTRTISISGNATSLLPVNGYTVIKYKDGVYDIARVLTAVFASNNNITSISVSVLRDVQVESVATTTLRALRDIIDPTELKIFGGDYTRLLTPGYVLSTTNAFNNTHTLMKVVDSSFDTGSNATIVRSAYPLPADLTTASVAPLLLLEKYAESFGTGYYSSDMDTDAALYVIAWASKFIKIESSGGLTYLSQTKLTDPNVDFRASNVQPGDILELITPSGTSVTGTVVDVISPHDVLYNTEEIAYIYSFSSVKYKIYAKTETEKFLKQPLAPVHGDWFVDSSTDSLMHFEHASWRTKYVGVSHILSLVNGRKIPLAVNDWSAVNSWTHRTQLNSLDGMIRAQAPIIEFSAALQLSDMSLSEYDWSYRKNGTVSYSVSETEPMLIELINLEVESANELPFTFPNSNTIVISAKYGNISADIAAGTEIVLSGFELNDGIYTVVDASYEQLTPTADKVSRLLLRESLSSLTDRPVGSSIRPRLTSHGDIYTAPHTHWRYNGIKNVVSTSAKPDKNNLHSVLLQSSTTSKNGYNWRSYSFVTGAVVDPLLLFAAPLHTYCLFDDYQEGDIRVYINKKRRYGNFIELPSYADDRYVGAIQLVGGIQLTENDVVLVEVGGYTASDAGRRAVAVNTPSGYELVNLSKYRKSEQVRRTPSQYPEFVVLNTLTRTPHRTSSRIFSYVEDNRQPQNRHVLKKLAVQRTPNGDSFVFRQHLIDGTKILAYQYATEAGMDSRTVWRVGANYEKYRPERGTMDSWKIPNNWYYNAHHENRERLSYLELYTHFRSIILAQKQPGLPADIVNSYFADSQLNYGLGGTIKEHNGNLDILASVIFNDNVTIEKLCEFAQEQYFSAIHDIRQSFLNNAGQLFHLAATDARELSKAITRKVIAEFENNTKRAYWFGDSSAFDGVDGIQGWIATLPMLGIIEPIEPYKIVDEKLALRQLVHHDGHRGDITISPALGEQLIAQIMSRGHNRTDIVSDDAQTFPSDIDTTPPTTGEYLLRTNTVARTRTLYRYNGTTWDKIVPADVLLECLLETERRLFRVASKSYSGIRYKLEANETNPLYRQKMERQFFKYAARLNILNPLSNSDRFSSNNPFTWNYYASVPTLLPNTAPYKQAGDWHRLYLNTFGTQFPHREPWRIRGFSSKPNWWDVAYVPHETTALYPPEMWHNILNGVVPAGRALPNGIISTGAAQVPTYAYLPVVTIPETEDGYVFGDLIPPFWNSANNKGVATIRSLFDPNAGDAIVAPRQDFIFGQVGDLEYAWSVSQNYQYDRLIVAFKLDPLRVVSKLFGYSLYTSGCLELHQHARRIQPGNAVIFHGEDDGDTIHKFPGFNQWYVNYNRYTSYDSGNAPFSSIWNNSSMQLAYQFDSLIDTSTFSVKSKLFDITEKDYAVKTKLTSDRETKRLDAINLTLIAAPAKSLGDTDAGWTVELSTIPTVKSRIEYFGVQNYEVSPVGNYFIVHADALIDVDRRDATDFIEVNYNNILRLSDRLVSDDNTVHHASVSIDGKLYSLSLSYQNVGNIEEFLDALNAQIEGGFFDLVLGNIFLYANTPVSSLVLTDGDLFSSIAGYVAIKPASVSPAVFERVFLVRGNRTLTYLPKTNIRVRESSIFNGRYTVVRSWYNIKTDTTSIRVDETIDIPNEGLLIDGVISQVDRLGLPEEWETGTEIYFNSDDTVRGLLLDRPYYIIRKTDFSFAIANSRSDAVNNIIIPLVAVEPDGTIRKLVVAAASLRAGRLERTFKANGGAVSDINWRVHAVDTRAIRWFYDGATVTGMQHIVDLLLGYGRLADALGVELSNAYTDGATGRPYGWEMYVEKYIDWAFFQRAVRQQGKLEYQVKAVPESNSFEFIDSNIPNWGNGSSVILTKANGATLPPEFVASTNINVPYYVIRTLASDKIQLALTTYDAARGVPIKFSTGSIGTIVMRAFVRFENRPVFTFAPFQEFVSIRHGEGLVSNVFSDSNYVYDLDGNNFDSSQLLINRSDSHTEISLLGIVRDYNADNANNTKQNPISIAGFKLAVRTFEHLLVFNNRTVNHNLIYDPFLGLRTPRFFIRVNRSATRTLRPTLGGYVLHNNSLVPNIEAAIDSSRYFYDVVKAKEGDATTSLVRRALGFNGPTDYMDALNVDSKAQFLFWNAMIQNKGTNLAATALTNHSKLGAVRVDEFWAYKVAEFGGTERLAYPEMRLLTRDAAIDELRIEFVPPTGAVTDASFEPVSLDDGSRWWDQPEQLRAMQPFDTFFFDVKVDEIITDVANKVIFAAGRYLMPLPRPAEAAIITYVDGDTIKTLVENIDYVFANAALIQFTTQVSPRNLFDLTIATLTYDFDSRNVSTIIDRTAGAVVSRVPFWNPAYGRHDLNFVGVIDHMQNSDPARYAIGSGFRLGEANNYWLDDNVGKLWMDTSRMQYLPYYDRAVMSDVNDRIFNWGRLADWAGVELYQWTVSNVHPSAWRTPSSIGTQRDGRPKEILYKNIGTKDVPNWIIVDDAHADAIAGLMTEFSAPRLYGQIEVYRNGRLQQTRPMTSPTDYLILRERVPVGTYLHFIQRREEPSFIDLRNNVYKFDIPHNTRIVTNPLSGENETLYYFWVANKHNKIVTSQREYTMTSIKNSILTTPTPYMILRGLRPPASGYGIIYGNIFDEFNVNLPYRYTQLIVKGLAGRIKDDGRYNLRFTKDFNLRDKLYNNSLVKKNVYTEWKLFREKRPNKIDRYLWGKLIEALIGFKLLNNSTHDASSPIPALNRIVYDRIYGGDSQIGLGDGQIFVDPITAKDAIEASITGAIIDTVDPNVRIVLENADYGTPEATIAWMNEIYAILPAMAVNKIFFDVLHVAMSLKREYADFIKTSWVAIQTSQEVNICGLAAVPIVHNLITGEPCDVSPPAAPPAPLPIDPPEINK